MTAANMTYKGFHIVLQQPTEDALLVFEEDQMTLFMNISLTTSDDLVTAISVAKDMIDETVEFRKQHHIQEG